MDIHVLSTALGSPAWNQTVGQFKRILLFRSSNYATLAQTYRSASSSVYRIYGQLSSDRLTVRCPSYEVRGYLVVWCSFTIVLANFISIGPSPLWFILVHVWDYTGPNLRPNPTALCITIINHFKLISDIQQKILPPVWQTYLTRICC